MRWFALLLTFLCCASCLYAQDADVSLLKTTVTLEDGTPVPNVPVTVTVNGKISSFITGKNGSFEGLASPGEATITAYTLSTTVTLVAGKLHEATLVLIPKKGVVITVLFPDGTPVPRNDVGLAYRAPNETGETRQNIPLGPGRCWFPDVPANATALSVIASTWGFRAYNTVRKTWDFTDTVELRQLSMTVPALVDVQVKIVDDTGKPLANTTVTWTLSYQYPPMSNYWNEDTGGRNQLNTGPGPVKTDAQGMISLPQTPPQLYLLSVKSGQYAGSPAPFEVKADGTATIDSYVIQTQGRRITQTVFGADGKPAPGAKVTASYCWGGKVTFADATADTNGVAVWADMPPARIIVWGEHVPAGVIDTEATLITNPLPPPVQDKARVSFRSDVRVETKELVDVVMTMTGEGFSESYTPSISRTTIMGWSPSGFPGAKFTWAAYVFSSPPRLAVIKDAYLPYVDGDVRTVTFPPEIPFTECSEVRGHFVTPDGARVPGVSRLQLLPVSIPAEYATLAGDPVLKKILPEQVNEHADGSFTAQLLCPGTYRLLVDLYDESAPALPELLFEVKPGVNDYTFKLPEPLTRVPGGTQFSWITLREPGIPRTLTVPAWGDKVPIFAPQEQLLACWFRPRPDALALWLRDGEKVATKMLPLRRVLYEPRTPEGVASWGVKFSLYPPLPGMGADPADSVTPIDLGTRYAFNLWAGKYLLFGVSYPFNTRNIGKPYAVLDVSDTGSLEQRFRLPYNPELTFTVFPRSLRMKFPPLKDPADSQRVYAAYLRFNVPAADIAIALGEQTNYGQYTDIPRTATKFSILRPGVGIIRDISLPEPDRNGQLPEVVLPAYQPGMTVAGRLLDKTGAPCKDTQLSLDQFVGRFSYHVTLKTDADGRFAFDNLCPGPMKMNAAVNQQSFGWAFVIPEGGLPNLTLHQPERTTEIVFTGNGNPEQLTLWWIPKDGKPMMLPLAAYIPRPASLGAAPQGQQNEPWRKVFCADLPLGAGYVFALDEASGRTWCAPTTLAAGENIIRDNLRNSLGLLVPYNLGIGVPGAVTLVGQGNLDGLTLTFPSPDWVPATALGLSLWQIQSIPSGAYKVIVYTGRGATEATVTVDAQGGSVRLPAPR